MIRGIIILFMFYIIILGVAAFLLYSVSSRLNRIEERVRQLEGRDTAPRRLGEDGLSVHSGAAMQSAAGSGSIHTAQHHVSTQAGESLVDHAVRKQGASGYVPHIGRHNDEPTAGERFAAWFKEDWMLKLGAFILLLGFVWLATYAFMHNWIGPMGRITLGIFAGASLMAFGWHRMQKFVHQGGIFLALGSSVIVLTLFAARNIYDFFTPLSALGIMFLSVVFVALASVKYGARSLALISLIIAGLTPLMVGFGGLTEVMLFTYLFIIIAGTVWVVALTSWRELLVAGLILITLYSIPQWLMGDPSNILMFAYAFAALFFVVGALGIIKSDVKKSLSDFIVAAGNGVFLLVWILNAVPEDWQSLVLAAWMVVFAVGGFMTFRITKHPAPFLMYATVATMFLAAATAIELEGATLTIAFIVEATVIPFLVYFLLRNLRTMERVGLLLIGPVFLALPSIWSYQWGSHVFHEDFFVLLLTTLALFAVGLFVWHKKDESALPLTFYPAYIVGGLIFGYVLIWLVLHAAMPLGGFLPTMLSLLIYLIIGLVRYFSGKRRENKTAKLHGSILVIFVVAHLLVIDLKSMEMGGRVITFFLLGALLMATAFLGHKKRLPEPGESH